MPPYFAEDPGANPRTRPVARPRWEDYWSRTLAGRHNPLGSPCRTLPPPVTRQDPPPGRRRSGGVTGPTLTPELKGDFFLPVPQGVVGTNFLLSADDRIFLRTCPQPLRGGKSVSGAVGRPGAGPETSGVGNSGYSGRLPRYSTDSPGVRPIVPDGGVRRGGEVRIVIRVDYQWRVEGVSGVDPTGSPF